MAATAFFAPLAFPAAAQTAWYLMEPMLRASAKNALAVHSSHGSPVGGST
jgi:hypothetical protein